MSKTVFVLVEVNALEGSSIEGVYSSEKYATKLAGQMNDKMPKDMINDEVPYFDVLPMILDAVPDGMTFR